MSSAGFLGLIDIERSSEPATPQATHQKNAKTEAPTSIELDQIVFGKRYNGPQSRPQSPMELTSSFSPPCESAPHKTPNELEMSRPPSPRLDEAVSLMQSWNIPSENKWRVLSCCLMYFVNGINDSAPGALIPYMETHYTIGYAVVSTIFVGQAAGFILAAFFNNMILDRIGRSRMLMAAEAIILTSYIIIVSTPPFPAIVVSFFLVGYGAAMTLALNNVFCANLHPSTAILGAAHGSYGVGGIVAPIAATAMVSKGMLWSRFYFLPLGLALLCMLFAGWTFWDYEEDNSPQALLTALEQTASRQEIGHQTVSKLRDLKSALKNRVTLFGALFIFAYQGAEVAISGWFISFLITYRGGDPASVGYVTSGFWAGITLGRFVLTHLAPRIGERIFVVVLICATVAFQLLAWLIPNVVGNAVAVSIIGLLLGPVYPCGQNIFTRLLPRHVQTTAISFISGAGSSGGAVAPFTTGFLAQNVGTFVLHPVCIGLYVVMLACWFALPKIRKRTE